MGFMQKIVVNTKKPKGLLGKMMVNGMNSGHAKMAEWGTKFLPPISPKEVIDLGCGGGKNIEQHLKRFADAKVTGIDYSPVSVEKAEKINAQAIAAGRCRISKEDVSALPFADESFDLATAYETIYFWPGPVKSFKEVARVLKSGGTFLIVNECDGKGKNDLKWLDMIDGMVIYSDEELNEYLKDAGFSDVKITHDRTTHWTAVVATK